jgi:hypothetical protein
LDKNPYIRLGLVLSISGGALAPVFYFVLASVPLTAIALSGVMVGLVSAMLGNARPSISPEACQMMLRTGIENTAALIEELGLESKGIYMPSSSPDGRPRVFIPLDQNGSLPERGQSVPDRLVVRYGRNLEDMCLVVASPGAVSLDGLTISPGGGTEQIEGILNSVLTGVLDLVDSVSAHAVEGRVSVEVTRPKLKYDNVWYYRCLGSPLASIVAAVCCQALGRRVRVAGEEEKGNRVRIEIEVLP